MNQIIHAYTEKNWDSKLLAEIYMMPQETVEEIIKNHNDEYITQLNVKYGYDP